MGVDRGSSGERRVSVGMISGAPSIASSAAAGSLQVVLPCTGLTFRNLFLPKASKEVRRQVVAEELAYSLPFSLAHAHYGIVEHGEKAWVAIASDSIVSSTRVLFPKANIEVEPLCYLRAAKAAGISNALVIDFGASKTVFCSLENGEVGTVRVLLRGGQRLTEAIASLTGLASEKAEARKREEGTAIKEVRSFYLDLLEEAILPSPLPYQRVLICGGGSATPGLLKLLSDHWGNDVDVEPFPLAGDLLPTDHVVAFGAALAGRIGAVKLRLDEGLRQGSQANGLDLRLAPLVLLALLMVTMTLSLEFRIRGLGDRQVQLKESLSQAIKPISPKAAELEPEAAIKLLKSQLEARRAEARSTPARIMTTLGRGSEAITGKKEASLYSIIYEDGSLKLEGRTKEIKQVEDIRKDLESVLSEVEVTKTRPNQNAFVYEIKGEPKQ